MFKQNTLIDLFRQRFNRLTYYIKKSTLLSYEYELYSNYIKIGEKTKIDMRDMKALTSQDYRALFKERQSEKEIIFRFYYIKTHE